MFSLLPNLKVLILCLVNIFELNLIATLPFEHDLGNNKSSLSNVKVNSNASSIKNHSTNLIHATSFDSEIFYLLNHTFVNLNESTLSIALSLSSSSSSSSLHGTSSSTSLTIASTALNIIGTTVSSIIYVSIISATLIGNLLVILAVIIVRKLHTQDNANNFLIVSLAVSDFLVGVLVMPFAFYAEMSTENKWYLGAILCDLWTLSDVLLCTASILNLCAISVDRYFIILHAMVYTQRRNAKLMFLMILIVWVISAAISIPPLFGWGKPSARLEIDRLCAVSADLKYQIYATLLAFYLPLIVMIIIYINIYRAARKIKKRENETACRLQVASPTLYFDSLTNNNSLANNNMKKMGSQLEPLLNKNHAIINIENFADFNNKPNGKNGNKKSNNFRFLKRNKKSVSESEGSVDHNLIQSNHRLSFSDQNHIKNPENNLLHTGSFLGVNQTVNGSRRESNFGRALGRRFTTVFSGMKRNSGASSSHGKNQKATRTLGVIMGCFILCWLPFFILAVVKPIRLRNGYNVGEYIPKWLDSLLLWLGYFNSALNPMIYARFNREFRRPFIEILCFRCRGINDKLRDEERKKMYYSDASNSNKLSSYPSTHPANHLAIYNNNNNIFKNPSNQALQANTNNIENENLLKNVSQKTENNNEEKETNDIKILKVENNLIENNSQKLDDVNRTPLNSNKLNSPTRDDTDDESQLPFGSIGSGVDINDGDVNGFKRKEQIEQQRNMFYYGSPTKPKIPQSPSSLGNQSNNLDFQSTKSGSNLINDPDDFYLDDNNEQYYYDFSIDDSNVFAKLNLINNNNNKTAISIDPSFQSALELAVLGPQNQKSNSESLSFSKMENNLNLKNSSSYETQSNYSTPKLMLSPTKLPSSSFVLNDSDVNQFNFIIDTKINEEEEEDDDEDEENASKESSNEQIELEQIEVEKYEQDPNVIISNSIIPSLKSFFTFEGNAEASIECSFNRENADDHNNNITNQNDLEANLIKRIDELIINNNDDSSKNNDYGDEDNEITSYIKEANSSLAMKSVSPNHSYSNGIESETSKQRKLLNYSPNSVNDHEEDNKYKLNEDRNNNLIEPSARSSFASSKTWYQKDDNHTKSEPNNLKSNKPVAYCTNNKRSGKKSNSVSMKPRPIFKFVKSSVFNESDNQNEENNEEKANASTNKVEIIISSTQIKDLNELDNPMTNKSETVSSDMVNINSRSSTKLISASTNSSNETETSF